MPRCTDEGCEWYLGNSEENCDAQSVGELEEAGCCMMSNPNAPTIVRTLIERRNMPVQRPKIGDFVRVITNSGGHNYPIGTIGEVTLLSGDRSCQIRRDDNGQIGNWALNTDIEILDMSRQAQAARLKKKLETLTKDVEELTKKYARLTEYEDDEEEIADNIAKILKTGADKDAIHGILKEMKLDIKFK